jgi:hypothetical protein
VKELIDLFDLSSPGMESVRLAADRADWTAAGEALLTYYLGKRQRLCLDFWDMSGPDEYQQMPWGTASTHDQLWKNTPEKAAEGKLCASGHEFDFSRDEDIDWGSDVRLWADGGKYPLAAARGMLRRMYWLRALDLSYLRGDAAMQERATRQLVRIMESWWAQYEEDEFVITAAIRIADAPAQSGMIRTWFVFLSSPLTSTAFKLRMLQHIIEQAQDTLRRAIWHPWAWGLSEAVGLGYAGVIFPELKEAQAWRQRCFEFIDLFLRTELREDGTLKRMHFCPHYTGGAAAIPIAFLTQIARLGYTNKLSPDATAGLLRVADWIANVQKPDNTVPQITASDLPGFGRWLIMGAGLLNRPDWLYSATAGREGTPPDHTSHVLPQAGGYILRDGWGLDAMYACFHNGDYHNIERTDLAVDLYAFGRTLVTACGRYGYYAPEWKPYFATAGYNTLLVDGSPHQEWGVHSLQQSPDLHDTSWRLGKDVDWAWGTHPNGFDAAPDVRWQRGLLFVKGQYWLILDHIMGPGEHDCSLRWLLTPSKAVIEADGMSVHTENDGGNVRIMSALPAGATLDVWEASHDPIRGWYSPEHGRMMPAPQLEYTWRGGLPALAATLIMPYQAEMPGMRLALAEPEKGRFDITVSRPGAQDRLTLDMRGAGAAWLARTDGGHTSRIELTPSDHGLRLPKSAPTSGVSTAHTDPTDSKENES